MDSSSISLRSAQELQQPLRGRARRRVAVVPLIGFITTVPPLDADVHARGWRRPGSGPRCAPRTSSRRPARRSAAAGRAASASRAAEARRCGPGTSRRMTKLAPSPRPISSRSTRLDDPGVRRRRPRRTRRPRPAHRRVGQRGEHVGQRQLVRSSRRRSTASGVPSSRTSKPRSRICRNGTSASASATGRSRRPDGAGCRRAAPPRRTRADAAPRRCRGPGRGAPAQQGERRRVGGEQPLDEGSGVRADAAVAVRGRCMRSSFAGVVRNGPRKRRRPPLGRPSRLSLSVHRASSGPPDERSTTRFIRSAACPHLRTSGPRCPLQSGATPVRRPPLRPAAGSSAVQPARRATVQLTPDRPQPAAPRRQPPSAGAAVRRRPCRVRRYR